MSASTATLLRTTTSIGENFLAALEMLAKEDGAPRPDLSPIKRLLSNLIEEAKLTGYIGKEGKR